MATSAPRMARNFPAWEIRGGAHRRVACAELTVEIVKSGKTGIGVLLSRDDEPSCEIRIDGARVQIHDARFPSLSAVGTVLRPSNEAPATYLGFAFDNESLWNEGVREGALELDVSANGERTTLVLPMSHVWTGPHRLRDPAPAAPQRPSMPMVAPENEAPKTDGGS